MKSPRISRTVAALGTLAAMAWAGHAYAIEPGSNVPHQPGSAAGVPLGALPPPGFYFINNLNYVSGSLNNGNGDPVVRPFGSPVNATAVVDFPILVWVAPFHVLGAQWGVTLIQPMVDVSVTNGGVTKSKTGIDNTLINPATLSWHLPAGFFVSVGIPIGLKDGDLEDNAPGGTVSVTHLAANYWTFSPIANVAWFNGHGTAVSLNAEVDFFTSNDKWLKTPAIPALGIPAITTTYKNAPVFNLDFGVTQVLPGSLKKWTIGAVGYFVTQLGDDTTSGNAVAGFGSGAFPANSLGLNNSRGNATEKFGLGPQVGYNFGPVDMTFYVTHDLYAKNSTQNTTVWWVTSIPF